MSHIQRGVMSGGMVVVVLVMGGGWLQARQPASRAQEDVLPALLTEVRGLRTAMEQMASAGPRIQLFTSRLQLQEARITNMTRRLDTVRDALDAAQREFTGAQDEQRRFESDLAELNAEATPQAREVAKQVSGMLPRLKQSVVSRKQIVDRLVAEETQLTNDITSEQGRWTEINSRLDELERLLARNGK